MVSFSGVREKSLSSSTFPSSATETSSSSSPSSTSAPAELRRIASLDLTRAVFADVDVELDRIDPEGGRGVILEVDRLGLGLIPPILGARKAAQACRHVKKKANSASAGVTPAALDRAHARTLRRRSTVLRVAEQVPEHSTDQRRGHERACYRCPRVFTGDVARPARPCGQLHPLRSCLRTPSVKRR